MNELDLEDLESRLYSQVYHGVNEEPEQAIPPTNSGTTNLSKPTNDMRRSGARYFGPWSPGAKFQKQNSGKSPRRDANKSDSLYGKNSSKPRKPEIAINQVVVVSSKRPVPYGNSKQRSRAKWKERIRERINEKRQLKMQNIGNNIGEGGSKHANTNRSVGQGNVQAIVDVITLSDSEDDSCVLLENNWPVVSVGDSDDDAKNNKQATENNDIKTEAVVNLNDSQNDDVIFVEPMVETIEIINIDEESENHGKSSTETASSTSSDISMGTTAEKKAVDLHKERKELLSTPDSASNDFISTSGVELHQRNFNFSLHGSDFNTGDFVKPAPKHNETCETESSSSTTDANGVNLMKTVVFNEVDFPKDDIFAENNLESFGNFITPLRNNAAVVATQSSPVRITETQNKNVYSSDSSSESDFDESEKMKDVHQKNKQLPELSPMQSNLDQGNKDITPQAQKKGKKLNSMGSKYDLLDSRSETPTKDPKQKSNKKKKKKKKKSESNEESSSNGSRESPIPPTENEGDDDIKRKKKRRSSFLEGGANQKKKIVADGEMTAEATTTDADQEEFQNKESDSIVPSTSDLVPSDEIKKETEKKEVEVEIGSNKTDSRTTSSLKEEPQDSNLTGLVVIDQTDDNEMVISSDSDSVLSPLLEHSDIQLNCEDLLKDKKLSTSDPFLSCDFSVTALQRKMSDDPRLWEIRNVDRYPSERSRGRRCNKCKQFGHSGIRCQARIEPKCTLCGDKGHYEPRCPNKVCTQCGHRSLYSTNYCTACFKYRSYRCTLCSMKGHQSDVCPDLWRRYYLTTEEGPIVKNNTPPVKDARKMWCSGCAQNGHLEHECQFFRSVYPSADPFIKSFEEEPTRSVAKVPFYEPPEPIPSHHRANQFQEYDQRHVGNNYGHMNPHLMNPYMDGIFVAGQENFFHPMDQGLVRYPLNIYPGNQNHFDFNSDLPEFITLESEIEPQETSSLKQPLSKFSKRRNSMFFNSSALHLQHFIKEELQRLSKLSLFSNKTVKELKKNQAPRRGDHNGRAQYFEMLNMVLFGVFNLGDGKKHLERLKRFKRDKLKSRLDQTARSMLFKSYIYIFGNSKHNGVQYQELLRKI